MKTLRTEDDNQGVFFHKLGHFFPIFEKGQGRPPPRPPSSDTPAIHFSKSYFFQFDFWFCQQKNKIGKHTFFSFIQTIQLKLVKYYSFLCQNLSLSKWVCRIVEAGSLSTFFGPNKLTTFALFLSYLRSYNLCIIV